MTKQDDNIDATKRDDKATFTEVAEKKIEQIADEASGKAMKTENLYDREHHIFTN
jgi:hypothetical protein